MFLFYWWHFPSVEDNINLHHQSRSFKLWMSKKLFRHQRRPKIHCIDREYILVAIVKNKSDLLYRELEFFRCHPPSPPGLAAIFKLLLAIVRDSPSLVRFLFFGVFLPIRELIRYLDRDTPFSMYCWVKRCTVPPKVQLTVNQNSIHHLLDI